MEEKTGIFVLSWRRMKQKNDSCWRISYKIGKSEKNCCLFSLCEKVEEI